MSIEAASNVKIMNNKFAFTGSLQFTSLGVEIDIEPWIDNRNKIWNITVCKCRLYDNKGWDFQCEPNVQKRISYTSFTNNIVVSKCEIGSMRIQY